jgi:outer membrane protein
MSRKKSIEKEIAMIRKSVWIGILVVLLLGGGLTPVWPAEIKIGFVDIQRAVNECQKGKEAKKEIIKEAEKFQRALVDKQKELQTLKDSLEKQSAMLTTEARTTKEKEYQQKLRDFQRWGEDSQNEITRTRMEKERQISIGLQRIIRKVGEEEGYTLVLEKNESIVLFVSPSIDLTDRVIKVFDVQKK